MRIPISRTSISRTLISSAAWAIAVCVVSLSAAHGQATINDCEKIQAADAYNQCLAKFGPEAKVKSVEPERPGDVKANSAEAAATSKPSAFMLRQARHGRGGARRGGRHRISIAVHRRHK